MSRSVDPRIDAIERRLVSHTTCDVPSGHRDRVLAAVRDVLAEDLETIVPSDSEIGLKGASALLAIALSTALIIVVPWSFLGRPLLPVPTESTLMARARSAGIDLPVETVATTDHSVHQPRQTPSPMPAHDAIRWRHLIIGDL